MKVDIEARIDAITRQVRSGAHDDQETNVAVASRAFDATPQRLWAAITEPEQLEGWFLPVSGELRLGGRYQLEGNAGGTITACEPAEHLALTWEFGGERSWLELRLSPVSASRTQLELAHASPPGEHWTTYGPAATGVGWELALLGLHQFLAAGETGDKAEQMAWPASEEGKAFIRACCDGWAQAAIAAGDDPRAAHAAAARTAAFYTGE